MSGIVVFGNAHQLTVSEFLDLEILRKTSMHWNWEIMELTIGSQVSPKENCAVFAGFETEHLSLGTRSPDGDSAEIPGAYSNSVTQD